MSSPEPAAGAGPGFTFSPGGAAFSVFSRNATLVKLCLFENGLETRQIALERQGDFHSTFIAGAKPGFAYGLRAIGPWAPEFGLCFDPAKLLLDPYAHALDGPFHFDDRLAERHYDTKALVPKAIAQAPLPDLPLRQVKEPDFIYELQVRSFSMLHPNIPEAQRGTVSALKHPAIIAHLKNLGVDTIELMPITAWIDERHLAHLGLRNAWGYNPVSFFVPDPKLAPGGLAEVRETVAALHAAGFNVILDMVFNHSGEGDAEGPVLSFRGLDGGSYYALANGQLVNDTGTGNTLALNREPMLPLVLASLRHWVLQAGIDGFRFDLASVMGRSGNGFDPAAPLLQAIEADPVLNTRIMIAEPWDVGPGGYQLGQFPPRWLEWNDRFRDDVRRFWKGTDFSANAMASRLAGSEDVFGARAGQSRSVNFIAAHDGFSLHDLTVYDRKDNFANGEGNRDGNGDEVTCVGASPAALIGSVLLSRGVAMITAGDEMGRTQKGNNNAYAQDNALSWLDWANADLALIAATAAYAQKRRALGLGRAYLDPARTRWLGGAGEEMNWSLQQNPVVTLEIDGKVQVTCDQARSAVTAGK